MDGIVAIIGAAVMIGIVVLYVWTYRKERRDYGRVDGSQSGKRGRNSRPYQPLTEILPPPAGPSLFGPQDVPFDKVMDDDDR